MNINDILSLSAEKQDELLGFEVAHIGINCPDGQAADSVSDLFHKAFGFPVKQGNSSNFASSGIEVMRSVYLGQNGHIAIRTTDIQAAMAVLEQRGFAVDMDTAKYKGDAMVAVYLKQEFGGFAVHLLQK